MTANNAEFDQLLAKVFSNGRGEVGLEVGADPGLAAAQYIQIPRCLEKRWVARGDGARAATPDETIAQLTTVTGWISTGSLLVHEGRLWVQAADGTRGGEVTDFRCEKPTYEDVRRFVAANLTHVRDAEFTPDVIKWVHAIRFWSVVSGFVVSAKSSEYTVVANPTDIPDTVDEIARFILEYSGQSWTACAARATSWRKSNHATGGDRATGFPRRWLQKEGQWPMTIDRKDRDRAEKSATDAFYVATHPSSVHAVLALMAPDDDCHWALIDPKYGLIPEWDVRESTKVRISPKTQVAGVSMVTDAMVCLQMLTKEGISPLLSEYNQFHELVDAYRVVEQNGVRVATYASWFLDGHPQRLTRVAFNQKDTRFAALVGELGAAAETYYSRTTIGESPSLRNASMQLCSDSAKQIWVQLSKAKKQMNVTAIMRAFGRIKGASAASRIADINSSDATERQAAVTSYNDLLVRIATAIGVSDQPTITDANIAANAEAADKQASALNVLEQATRGEVTGM